MKAATMQEFKVFKRETRGEVGCRLNAPLEVRIFANQALRDGARPIKVNQEVIVDDPQHFEAIPAAEVDGLFDKLLGRQCIPFASVDACIRTVPAVVGARET